MANKKNRKKNSQSQKAKKISNVADSSKAVQYALNSNINRITGSILLGQQLNPTTHLESPCVICNKRVLDNQNGIECDNCKKWCHRKCDGMNVEMYKFLDQNPDVEWRCLYCTMIFNHEHIPFTLSDNSD